MSDPHSSIEHPAEVIPDLSFIEVLGDFAFGFLGWFGDQEFLVAIIVAVLIYRYQRRNEKRALASALYVEVGMIIDRVCHMFEVRGDRAHFASRMKKHQQQDDWDALTLIYEGNVANLARLPFDLISDLAVLYGNLARFRSLTEEDLLDVGEDGKLYGEVLLEKVISRLESAGSKLEWTSLPLIKKKFTYKRWFSSELRKRPNRNLTRDAMNSSP